LSLGKTGPTHIVDFTPRNDVNCIVSAAGVSDMKKDEVVKKLKAHREELRKMGVTCPRFLYQFLS
jgi:hypothetical protein